MFPALLIIIFFFALAAFIGAPFLPIRRVDAESLLDMLDLKPGQVMFDLGSGDGRLLRLAAERGWRAVGYEVNPILVAISYWRCRHQLKMIRIVWGNFWNVDFSKADGVCVFLVGHYMPKLAKKFLSLNHDLKLASYVFPLPGVPIEKQSHNIYLYRSLGTKRAIA